MVFASNECAAAGKVPLVRNDLTLPGDLWVFSHVLWLRVVATNFVKLRLWDWWRHNFRGSPTSSIGPTTGIG